MPIIVIHSVSMMAIIFASCNIKGNICDDELAFYTVSRHIHADNVRYVYV